MNIGRYRILRLLGEGGMGAVYEAEQDQPRHSVALKVIKGAWASPGLRQRFELESQALARRLLENQRKPDAGKVRWLAPASRDTSAVGCYPAPRTSGLSRSIRANARSCASTTFCSARSAMRRLASTVLLPT